MLKRRGFGLMIVSLVLALGAAWVARGWVQSRLQPGKPAAQMTVVVAATAIPRGIQVAARNLRVIALPASAPIGAHFSSTTEVVGLVALEKAVPGEILLAGHFAKKLPGSTLATLLEPTMRAITVPVNDVVGVAGFLLPGNHVDVVEARMVNQRAVTSTILQNLLVMAVDQTDSRNKDSPVLVRAVTLEVTPLQAQVLVKALAEGKIQLTLRSPLAPNASGLALAQTPPKPVVRTIVRRTPLLRRPDNLHTITVIRGTNVQRVHTSG